MFLLFLLWGIFINPVNESPSYKIEPYNESFKIVVTAKSSDKKTMMEEAKKSSLLGMAYIHHLANENHPTAENIAAFYEDYRNFLIEPNKNALLQRSKSILSSSSDEFSKSIALYLNEILTSDNVTKSDGKTFMEDLIPFIKESLQMPKINKICPEQLVNVPEIQAPHNAFPDLIKYQGSYYASFREANTHVEYKDYGKIRILRGNYFSDTCQWDFENVALLEKEPYDLRDPKFFIDSNNNLRLIVDASVIDEESSTKQLIPYTAYLDNNKWVLEKADVDISADGVKGQWLWRVTWNDQMKAGFGFSYKESGMLSLMKTTDGLKYDKIVTVSTDKLPINEQLSEATIRFKQDGTAIALIRTERHGLIGVSKPESNYTKWSFQVIPFRVGGPNFVVSETDNKIWAATRYIFLNRDNSIDDATIVASMNEKELIPCLRLKSYLDSSYPGLVLEEDNSLSVLYYSSEPDGKSQIYITRVALP